MYKTCSVTLHRRVNQSIRLNSKDKAKNCIEKLSIKYDRLEARTQDRSPSLEVDNLPLRRLRSSDMKVNIGMNMFIEV